MIEQARRVMVECGRIATMTEEPGRITRRAIFAGFGNRRMQVASGW